MIVQELIATSDAITVVIRNVGGSTVVDAFWVDVYIDPTEPPSLNKMWQDIAGRGLAWGVTDPIPAGDEITLTIGGEYYVPDESNFTTLLPGTPIWAQVDSIDFTTTYGAVSESNEANNIFGPVSSIASQGDSVTPLVTRGGLGPRAEAGKLPSR